MRALTEIEANLTADQERLHEFVGLTKTEWKDTV